MKDSSPSENRLRDIKGLAASDHLDLIRGLAAVAVLIHHSLVVLLYPDRASSRLLERTLARASEWGSLPPVIIFFVLSGYLIAGSIYRDHEAARWNWRNYFCQRLTRLWIVLLPGLILTFCWDAVSFKMMEGKIPHPAFTKYVSAELIRDRSDAATYLGCATFLNSILVAPNCGSNVPLWSLSFEWWYYVAFPCFWVAIRSTRLVTRVTYLALGLVVLVFVGKGIASYFAFWLCGAALAAGKLPKRTIGRSAGMTIFVLFLTIGLTIYEMKLVPSAYLTTLVLAICTTAGLYGILQDRRPSRNGLYSKFSSILSGFSFTLYVVHMPVLILLRSGFTYESPWPIDLHHLTIVGLIILGIIGYAYAMSRVTEAYTDRVRKWIQRKLNGFSATPVNIV